MDKTTKIFLETLDFPEYVDDDKEDLRGDDESGDRCVDCDKPATKRGPNGPNCDRCITYYEGPYTPH